MPSSAPPTPVSSFPPGARLGRYEIVSELGTGGMATVYLGRALAAAGFQRLVAIKILHPHLLRDDQFIKMFLDEGRLAARIHHPNVVGTLDLEHTDQGIYIVSEYIEGDQLLGLYKSARAHDAKIPLAVSLRITLDVLAGLQSAHDLTDDLGTPLLLVHRDVSPHNILVGTDGISRLTDFGIARAEERISDTRDGIVKGKLSYMAPEQPDGLPFDRRADLFSMATVLWECLTSRRLFPGKTDGEVLQNLLHKPIPRLRDADASLPVALDEVLARALCRDPEARYPTAGAFADALEAAAPDGKIASYRAVAEYVKTSAATKISNEHARRRATTRDIPIFRGSLLPTPSESHSPPPTASVQPTPPSGAPPVSLRSQADEAPTQLQPTSVPPTLPTARVFPPPPALEPIDSSQKITARPPAPKTETKSKTDAIVERPIPLSKTSGIRQALPPSTDFDEPETVVTNLSRSLSNAPIDDSEAKTRVAITPPSVPALPPLAAAPPAPLPLTQTRTPAPPPPSLPNQPSASPSVRPAGASSAPLPTNSTRHPAHRSHALAWVILGVVFLGSALGYGIWTFLEPSRPPTPVSVQSPQTVHPVVPPRVVAPLSQQPTPAPVAAQPTPAPVAAQPTPAPVAAQPTPSPVTAPSPQRVASRPAARAPLTPRVQPRPAPAAQTSISPRVTPRPAAEPSVLPTPTTHRSPAPTPTPPAVTHPPSVRPPAVTHPPSVRPSTVDPELPTTI